MAAFGAAPARQSDPVLVADVIELPAKTLDVPSEIDESSAENLAAQTVRRHCGEPDCILCFPQPQLKTDSTWVVCLLVCFLLIVCIGGIAGAWILLFS